MERQVVDIFHTFSKHTFSKHKGLTMSQLHRYREAANLTQEQLSAKSNISVRTIQRIEAGQELKGHTLTALARSLEISKEELLGIEKVKQEDNISLVKLINLSSIVVIFVPCASILLPLIIMFWKKEITSITKQIVSIQILWTLLFIAAIVTSAILIKIFGLSNQLILIPIFILLLTNAYIIIRNTIALDKSGELSIKLNFSML